MDEIQHPEARGKQVLFICYSHTDLHYKERFDKFLQSAAIRAKMDVFSDANIAPGDKWQREISDGLQRATAALLLISQDFMISPFIQQVELRELLNAQIRRGLRLFLVAVRATLVEGTYLENFQWARPASKPLYMLSEEEQEAEMVEICRLISREMEKKPDPSTIEKTINCLDRVPKLDLPPIYELEGMVGEGSFARCYRAKDRLLNRDVVIKVLEAELARDSEAYDRYVGSAAKLRHRNILGLLFAQTNKIPHFIVTPHLDGQTLKEKIDETDPSKREPFEERVRWIIRIAATLHYVHAHGCVHGGLRPCEIRLDGDEKQPVLKGFRTVEWINGPVARKTVHKLSLEDFFYSSPEVRAGAIADPKSDQYLLGLVAYELIAGSRPAAVTSWASLLDPRVAAALAAPPPLVEVAPACTRRVSEVIMRMLERDPANRWDNLQMVAEKLDEALTGAYCHEVAKESYRRCAQNPAFYRTVYGRLFALMPESRAMFKKARISLDRQYEVLRDAIWLLLTYPETRKQGEPTILSRVARTHAHLTAGDYDKFSEAVLEAVAEHDSPDLVEAWSEAMKPGLSYLVEQVSANAGPRPDARAAEPSNGAAHASTRRRSVRDRSAPTE